MTHFLAGGTSFGTTDNSGRPYKPSRAALTADIVIVLRVVATAVLFTALLVSFNPFPDVLKPGASVPLNMLGYTSLSLGVIASHVLLTGRSTLKALFSIAWLVLILPLPLSMIGTDWPSDSVRAMLFTFATMVAATGLLTLPPDANGFRTALIVASLVVLAVCYAGVILWPIRAIHQAYEVEAEHAGMWRGLYSHKNITGPVMAALVFGGLYLMRSGARLFGLAITGLALFFLIKTGSKTSVALVPVIAGLIVVGPWIVGRALTAIGLFCSFVGLLALTVGAVVFPFFGKLLHDLIPGTTFSGRTDLWRFALDLADPLPIFGFGYGNFWSTPVVENSEKPFELAWDMRGAAHAHNSFLDAIIQLGWPGFAAVLLVLVLLPLVNYIRCRPGTENRRLADFFLMVLGFMLLNATLESFFFDRDKATWVLLWISVLGLHMTARLSLAEDAKPTLPHSRSESP